MRILLAAALTLMLASCKCGSENILTMATPAVVSSFEVRDTTSVLWKIESDPPRQLSEIRYGQVPAGFVQITPAGGVRPRKFRAHEELTTFAVTPERTFLHHGQAVSETAFCGGVFESSPFPRKTQS